MFQHHRADIVDNTLLANYLTPRMVRLGIKVSGLALFSPIGHYAYESRLTLFELRPQAGGHADIRTTQRYIADDVKKTR
jgi:hypothetical protein